MNTCKKCGTCCRAIPLRIDLTRYYLGDYKANLELVSDGEIIIPNWVPISRDKAIEINPRLAGSADVVFFYTCRLIDEQTNECMIHFSNCKPHACLGFPWYGRSPDICLTCADDCGYNDDYEMVKAFSKFDPKIFMERLIDGW